MRASFRWSLRAKLAVCEYAPGAPLVSPGAPNRRYRCPWRPGEKQIELDRRMIGDAIKRTRERLVKVKRQRSGHSGVSVKDATPSIFHSLDIPTRANQPFQCFGEGQGVRSGSTFRHAGHHDAAVVPRRCGTIRFVVRHGGLHSGSSPWAGRCVPGHAAGGGRRRFAASRGGRFQPGFSGADGAGGAGVAGNGASDIPQILVFNKLDAA